VTKHLDGEIAGIEPRAVIALGRAALKACALIAKQSGERSLTGLGVEVARLRHQHLRVSDGTRLPGRPPHVITARRPLTGAG
jgi:uracil-DNA glycosylase